MFTAILSTLDSSNPVSSNPVSSTNKFKLKFTHGWVVNLLSLQPSGMHIQRKGKEQTIFFNGGTARSGQKIASKNHLNHSEIVELFKIKQVLTEVKVRQLMAGGTRRRQAPRQRNKDFRIKATAQRTLITTLS